MKWVNPKIKKKNSNKKTLKKENPEIRKPQNQTKDILKLFGVF